MVEKSAQQLLKKYNPGNKSAHVKQAVDMLLQLQKTQGNPKAINAIGAGNLAGMLKDFSNKFLKKKKDDPKEKKQQEELQKEIEKRLKQIEDQQKINDQTPGFNESHDSGVWVDPSTVRGTS